MASAYSSCLICKELVGSPEDHFIVGLVVDGALDVVLQLHRGLEGSSLEITSAIDFGSCPSSGS